MACVGDGEGRIGRVIREGDGGGKASLVFQLGEILIEFFDEATLINLTDMLTHQGTQFEGDVGNFDAVATDICQEDASDATGGTTGDIVNISTPLGRLIGLRVNPHFQAEGSEGGVGGLIASPHFHAGHVGNFGSG